MLRSLIIYVHGTVFLTFLINKTSSELGVQHFAKMFLNFRILTSSPTLNLELFLLLSTSKAIYVFD